MAGAGNEVGKISIRVVPNLEDFHDDLKRQLADEEKKRHKVKVGVDVDTSDIPKEVKAAEKAVGDVEVDVRANTDKYVKDVEKATKDFDDAEVDLKTNLDRFKRRYLNKFQSLMSEFEANLPLTVDNEEIRKGLNEAEKEFANRLKLIDPKADIETVARLRRDVEQFYREARDFGYGSDLLSKEIRGQVQNVIKATESRTARIQAEIDLDTTMADLERSLQAALRSQNTNLEVALRPKVQASLLRTELALLKLKLQETLRIPVKVDVDKGRISKAFGAVASAVAAGASALGSAASGAASGLSAMAAGAGSAVKAISAMPEWILLTAAVIGVLAPALSLVTGALVALPGVLAAIAVPAAAVALGMDGIKKAAEKAGASLDAIKKKVSDTFENGLVPAFENIKSMFADVGFQDSFTGVADGLSKMATNFTEAFSKGDGLERLKSIITSVGDGLKTAAPGIQSFTSGILGLADGLAQRFPDMGAAFSNVGKEFDAWVDKISNNGQLQSAFDSMRGTLGEIGGIVKDIASYSFDQLADPQFGESMKGFVQDVRSLVNDVLPLLKSGFEDVAQIVRGIRDTVDAIKGAADWVGKLTGAGKGLEGPKKTDGFMGLFGKDGVLGDNAPFRSWFGDAPKVAAEAGAEAGKQFQQNLSQAAAATQGDAGALTEAINNQLTSAVNVSKEAQKEALRSAFTGTGVTDAVKAQIGTQMQGIITEAQAAVTQLGPVLQQGIDQAVLPLSTLPAKVGQAFATLGPSITGAWGVVSAAVTDGVNQMTTAITSAFNLLPQTATTAFQGVQNSIVGAFAFMVTSIGQQAGQITNAVQQAFNQIPQVITGALSQAVSAVASSGSQIVTAFQASVGQLPALASETFTGLVTTVQTAMDSMVAAITNGGSQAVAAVQGWSGQIQSALQSLASGARASGEAVGREFAGGISSQSGAVAAAAQQLVAAARQFFPNSPAEAGPFSGSGWVDKSGEAVGEGFASGLSSSQQEVVETARALMQAVKDIFGSAEGLTLNFNMGPVTQAAEAATKSVQTFGDTLKAVPAQQLDSLRPDAGTPDPARKDELSRQLNLLEQERKSIEIAKSRGEIDDAAAKARLAEIRDQKNILGLEKDKLVYAEKYGDQVGGANSKMDEAYKDLTKKALNMPVDFGRTVASQFGQDLGISGGGLMGAITDYGLQFGSQFVFNVSNIDEAMAVQKNQVNKRGMGVVGR